MEMRGVPKLEREKAVAEVAKTPARLLFEHPLTSAVRAQSYLGSSASASQWGAH